MIRHKSSWMIVSLLCSLNLASKGALAADAAPQPIQFDEALTQILSRSTAIASQQASLGIAEANRIPARFVFLPSLSFYASETWTGTDGSTLSSALVEGVAKLNLVHWGADLAGLHAANLDVETQKANLESTWLSTEDDAVRALIDQIQRRREVEVNQGIVKSTSELLNIAKQRYQGGLLPLQEVDKASIDLDNANASLADAELRETVSKAALEKLLGHSNVAGDWPWKDRISKVDVNSIAGDSLGFSQRPDWRAAQAKSEAENQRYQRNLRLLLPSVDSSIAYGNYTNPGATLALPGSGTIGWRAQISVSLPFFDNLVSYTNVRTQLFTRTAAEVALSQVERNALGEWRAAKQVFKTALATAQARDRTLTTSHKIYQDNLRRFQAGRISVNDLALDQRRIFDSELFGVQGWSAAHQAYARLCHSVGRRVSQCGP